MARMATVLSLFRATADGVCRLPFWCELHREEEKPADTLRVVTYNVLVGFRDSEVGRFLPGCRRGEGGENQRCARESS